VVVKENQKKEFETRHFRDAILFEELLSKELDIPLYDTTSAVFLRNILLNLFIVGAASWVLYLVLTKHEKYDKKPFMKWSMIVVCVATYIMRLKHYRDFQKTHVERIVYNTVSQQFTFTRRRVIGVKYMEVLHKNELLYATDPILHKRRINYINMVNLNTYCIGYKNAWLNQALFSHLIAQNIKSL
jgi:hypothetical protein